MMVRLQQVDFPRWQQRMLLQLAEEKVHPEPTHSDPGGHVHEPIELRRFRMNRDGWIHHITSKKQTHSNMQAMFRRAVGLDFTRRNKSSRNGSGKWKITAPTA